MPSREDRPIAIRFTPEQLAWLHQESERLDRSMSWIIRNLVAAAIKENRRLDPLPVSES